VSRHALGANEIGAVELWVLLLPFVLPLLLARNMGVDWGGATKDDKESMEVKTTGAGWCDAVALDGIFGITADDVDEGGGKVGGGDGENDELIAPGDEDDSKAGILVF
jgi:hypothetical protein